MSDFATAGGLAVRALRRHPLRYALMAGLLGLAVGAYFLYATFILGARSEARLSVAPHLLPADVVLLGRTALTPEAVADWARRGGVLQVATARLTRYLSDLGDLRVLFLPADSPLWTAAGVVAPARSGLLWLPPSQSPGAAGAGAEAALASVTLIPPRVPAGAVPYGVLGRHAAADSVLGNVALALLPDPGPSPNSLFVWTSSQGAASSLAVLFELEYLRPRRPVLHTVDDATVYWAGTADRMATGVVGQTYMPGFGAMSLVFAFCAIGLFTLASLGFLDRKRDIAILKTVGLESRGLLTMLLIEQAVVTAAGLSIGLAIALIALPRLAAFMPGQPSLAWGTVLKGALAGLAVQGAGVTLPALTARAATVNQLLYNLPIPIRYQRVYEYKE